MSTELSIFIPQVGVWMLRLAISPNVSGRLRSDPVAFAAWYAVAGETIEWPEEVIRIQNSERAKRLSLERMMKLLSQVNYAFLARTSAEHARRVLEGYAVHHWVASHHARFIELATTVHGQLKEWAEIEIETELKSFAARLQTLGRVLGLSRLEHDILRFAFMTSASDELVGVLDQLASDRWTASALWPAIFDATNESLAKAMRTDSPLRLSGILQATGRNVQFACVARFWVDLLAMHTSLFDALLEPVCARTGSGRPARLAEEDLAFAARLLRNASEPGVNLLLYGASSLDKRRLLSRIVSGAGRTGWRVRSFENAPREVLPSLAFVAFQLLTSNTKDAVLVIEQPSEVLHTNSSGLIRALFGIEVPEDTALPFDENLLSTNPTPGIWLCSDLAALPDDTIARFVFHAPLKKADRAELERAANERLKELRLSAAARSRIAGLPGVSAAQLESAVKAARLLGCESRSERDESVVQAVLRSQRALSRELKPEHKPSVTQYSLEYLNTAGRFTPEQIVESFRRRPKGLLLLYGLPGTGKTQFAEYLAAALGRPLHGMTASALLSKWLGESEKNISTAFEEALAEDAVLFFDEGDSFLRSRNLAEHSWEVTQTNELLQHMERFEGILIMATNLFRDLDAAALRRFTFKIEFRELDADQRWSMFVTEAGLTRRIESMDPQLKESWQERLLLMKFLTPGDFATVKRQCLLLNTTLSPEEWLRQLEIECEIKQPSGQATRRRLS